MELTKNKSNQFDKSKRLHDLLSVIYRLESDTIINFLDLGKFWNEIIEDKLWKNGGSEANTFEEFCEKECNRDRTTVYKWVQLYQIWGNYADMLRGVSVDYKRLLSCAKLVNDAESARHWLHVAVSNSQQNFKDTIREAKGQQMTIDCEHDFSEDWLRCVKCGKLLPKKFVVQKY